MSASTGFPDPPFLPAAPTVEIDGAHYVAIADHMAMVETLEMSRFELAQTHAQLRATEHAVQLLREEMGLAADDIRTAASRVRTLREEPRHQAKRWWRR